MKYDNDLMRQNVIVTLYLPPEIYREEKNCLRKRGSHLVLFSEGYWRLSCASRKRKDCLTPSPELLGYREKMLIIPFRLRER